MTYRLPFLLATLLIVTVGLAVSTPPHRAVAAGPAVAVAPSSARVAVGGDLSVDFTVADVSDAPGIGGYALHVAWDPAILDMTSIDDAGFVTSGENIVICVPAAIDNAAGRATLDCIPLPFLAAPGVATAAPRAFARSGFHARAAGVTMLNLAGTFISSPGGEQLDASLGQGTVTVESAATPPAGPTAAVPAGGGASPPTPVSAAAGQTNSARSSTNGAGQTLGTVGIPQTGAGPQSHRNLVLSTVISLAVSGAALVTLGLFRADIWLRPERPRN